MERIGTEDANRGDHLLGSFFSFHPTREMNRAPHYTGSAAAPRRAAPLDFD
jgi:hypothetical protein